MNIKQGLSTTAVPPGELGVCKIIKITQKEDYVGGIFYLGVCEMAIILIWWYAEGYNFDLGVCKYQKVENRWHITTVLKLF